MLTTLTVALSLSSLALAEGDPSVEHHAAPPAVEPVADPAAELSEPGAPETDTAIDAPAPAPRVAPVGWREVAAPSAPAPAPTADHPDSSPMIAFGAAYGAYAGGMGAWLIGEALEASEEDHRRQGVAPGLMAGATTGAVASYFLSRGNPQGPQAVGLVYSGTSLGTYYGEQLGRLLIPHDAPGAVERTHAAGLAGSMAGVGIGSAFGHRAAPVGHQAHFALANGIGWLAGRGVGDLAEWDNDGQRRLRAAVETGGSVGLGTVAALANRSDMDAPRGSTIGVALVDGAWFGGWSPFLFADAPTGRQVVGGAQLGTGVGYGATIAMSLLGQPSPRSAALQGVGLAAGSALGAGLPLSLGAEGPARTVVGPMLGVGAAGQALGAAIAPRYNVDANDKLLLATLESWTAYQAVGWSFFARHTGATDTQAVGYAMTAGGAGTLATMALLPALDVTPQGSTMLLTGGAWGTWFGAWGSQLANADADGLWLASLAAGDGAMLASAIVQGAGWQPTWRQVGYVNGFGLLGAAGGGLLGAIALYDPDDWTPVSAAIVGGSAVGLIGGGVLGSVAPTRERSVSRGQGTGTRSLAARLPFRTQVQAAPWASEAGDPGLYVQVDLAER